MGRPSKVLAYNIGSLGDTIVTIPSLRLLRKNFPGSEIVLLFESRRGLVGAPEVIPSGLVDRYISYSREPGSPFGPFPELFISLRRERFDTAAYLVFSERPPRTVSRDKYFFRACGIRSLLGFRAFSPAELYPRSPDGYPAAVSSEAQRKFERLVEDGMSPAGNEFDAPWITPSSTDVDRVQQWLDEQRVERPLLAVAPGGKTPANRWPFERFEELIKDASRSWGAVIIVGGRAEAELGERLSAGSRNVVNAAGKFGVHDMAALLSLCGGYVGVDTGTTHLAAAVGTPFVAVYHQRDHPGHWFASGRGDIIQSAPVACAGCRAQVCPVPGHPCISQIDIQTVLSAVEKMHTASPVMSL